MRIHIGEVTNQHNHITVRMELRRPEDMQKRNTTHVVHYAAATSDSFCDTVKATPCTARFRDDMLQKEIFQCMD